MNRLLGVALIGAALSAVAAVRTDDAAEGDLKKLQGRWLQHENKRVNAKPELVNLVHGRDLEEGELVNSLFFLAVEKDKFTFWYDEKQTRQATAKLHPTKEPKAIELTVGKGKPFLGIYKLDGDTLTLCLGDTQARPTALEAKEGQMLMRYKRDKK